MGLTFPDDLRAWQRWQRSRHRLRMLKDLARRPPHPSLYLHVRGEAPVVLFALEATTPTAIASIVEPLAHLGDAPVAVLAPADVSAELVGRWAVTRLTDLATPPHTLRDVRAIIATGHFLPAGAAAHRWSAGLGARFFVVQHGLLAPQAPPLPRDAHVLGFSDRDVEFWRSGRTDVTGEAIGSQLLWHAGADQRIVASDTAPVFLGQLHGAELPRRVTARTAEAFCRATEALYRPHPAETDRLSRRQHARWRATGIRFAPPGPLLDAERPVVAIFSTGVLEAAAAGIPAWVTCERPPAWVEEFWDRYALSPWGQHPTLPPGRPAIEPARAVAERALAAVKGGS